MRSPQIQCSLLLFQLKEAAVADPQDQAQKAFQQGRLLEANRFCDGILQSAPDNPFALDLKQQIRARYTKIAGRAQGDQKVGRRFDGLAQHPQSISRRP